MYGKIVGVLVGGVVAMLFGWSAPLVGLCALLGAIAGHFIADHDSFEPLSERPLSIDDVFSEPRRPAPPARVPLYRQLADTIADAPDESIDADPSQVQQAQALCPLFIDLARVDGAVVQSEVRVVREYFQHQLHFDAPGLEAVRAALKGALARPAPDFAAVAKAARAVVKPGDRLELLRALYELGLADGELKRSETDALRVAVQQLNVSDEQHQALTRELFGGGQAHFEVLGLTPDASDDDIRAAFRRLAAAHHPDRAGESDTFRRIKDAYDELRKRRGF